MEFEKFVSGYCRAMDASRMVTLECCDGAWEADCAFGVCPYENECPIGQQLAEVIEKMNISR